jgi:hypothetical protein
MRYKALEPSDIQAVSTTYLGEERVILSVVPEGRRDMAAVEEAT